MENKDKVIEELITGHDFIKSLIEYEQKHGRLSDLARALYIYNAICEYFSYKIDVFFFSKREKNEFGNREIDIYSIIEDDETVCTLLSGLYASLLQEAGIDTGAKTCGDFHKFVEFQIDGKKYYADPIYDLLNAKIKARFKNFGQYTQAKRERFPQLEETVMLSEEEMDSLYQEIRYGVITSRETGEERSIYYDDVIKQLKKEMQDDERVIRLFKELYGVDLQLSDDIDDFENKYKLAYYKMKFIFEFLSEELKFVESESFYKTLFNELFSDLEKSAIRYANFKDADGNNSYIFEFKEYDGTVHYFRSSFVNGINKIEEVDISSDESLVTLFDSKKLNKGVKLKDISRLGKEELVKPLLDVNSGGNARII